MFFGRAQDILRRGLRERELRTFYRDARCQEGALGAPLRKLRALTRGEVDEAGEGGDATLALLSDMPVPLSDLRDMLAGDVSVPGSGYSLWEIETLVEDSLRQLLGWAIYSFVAAVEVRANTCGNRSIGLVAERQKTQVSFLLIAPSIPIIVSDIFIYAFCSAPAAAPPPSSA